MAPSKQHPTSKGTVAPGAGDAADAPPRAPAPPGARVDDAAGARRIVAAYVLFAVAWIYLSDRVVGAVAESPEVLVRVEMAKGVLFIAVTALLLHALILRHTRRLRRVADELARSQQLTSSLLAATPDVIYVKDRDGRYLLASTAAATVVGRSVDEVLGQDDEALFGHEGAAPIVAADRRVLASAAVETFEEQVPAVDGAVRTYLTTKGPLLGDDGVPVGVFGIARDTTDRTEAARALEKSEARYRSLFLSLTSGVVHVRVLAREGAPLDAELLDANPALAAVAGIEPSQVGKRVRELLPGLGDATPEPLAMAGRVAATGVAERGEHYVAQLGRWVSLLIYRPAPGEAVVIAEDVTERKRAEAALKQSLRYNEQIIESAATGIIVYDRDLRYRVWNPYMERLTGRALADVLGKRPLDVFPFLEGTGVLDEVGHALEGRPGAPRDFPFESPAGTLWCTDTNAPLRDTSGATIGVIGMVQDITERRRAEEDARRQAGMLRSLLDAIPDPVFYKDAAGAYVDCNAAFAELVGRPRAEVLGKTDHDLFAKEVADFFREQDRRMVEAGRPRRNEEWVDYPGGRKVLLDTVKSPYVAAAGGPVGVLGVSRDVTERARMEAEKDALRAQLQQSQRMESVGRLAAGIAHDFNNILQAQKGHCELMALDVRGDDPLAEGLAEIDACVDRATSLTRQLLAFSRKQVLMPQVIDVGELLANLEKMLRRLIGEDVALEVEASGGPFTVFADPGQIEQVIVNIVVNARDAMPTGGRLGITVGTTGPGAADDGRAPRGHVTLSIRDTGAGMDEETRARLFEPFFTTKPLGKGTGLGLATVYGIVRQSDGDIAVESALGRGTTFVIRLPRVDGVPARSGEAGGALRGAGQRVLVVDDDVALGRVAGRLLEQLGYRPEVMSDPQAAIALVEDRGLRPDVLVTDVVMPGMSGQAMVERLRRTLPSLKVMYMSGYTDDATVHHGVAVDGVVFLQKPFSRADLAKRVREALDRPA